jgi:hypothetical protein
MRKSFVVGGLLAVGVLVLTVVPGQPVSAAAASCEAEEVALESLEQLSAAKCDLSSKGLDLGDGRIAEIPAKEEAVSAHYLGDGSSPAPSDYTIAVDSTGQVGVILDDHDGETLRYGSVEALRSATLDVNDHVPPLEGMDRLLPNGARANDEQCSTGQTPGQPWSWAGVYKWKWSTWPAPTDPTMPTWGVPVHTAAQWIEDGKNVCGIDTAEASAGGFNVWPIRQEYLGITSTDRPGVTVSSNDDVTCGPRDNKNTIGFSDFVQDPYQPGILAVACTWYWLGGAEESDIAFDLYSNWNPNLGSCTTPYPANGASVYDMHTVALHELGHVFGLGHAAAGSGQIMRPSFSPCERQHGLGIGDWWELWMYH